MSHQQDPGRDGVEDAGDDVGRRRIGIVGIADAETDGEADGRHEGVDSAGGERYPVQAIGKREVGESRAETETFEHLVELCAVWVRCLCHSQER